MQYGPFRPLGSTVPVSASTTSAPAAIPTGNAALRIFNSTSAIAFFKTGSGDQTATTTDTPVAPNSVEVFTVPESHNGFACVLSTGTGTVYATRGEGV